MHILTLLEASNASVSIQELASIISTIQADDALDELILKLDERLFKSSRIARRGEFVAMCHREL